jgi:hypothetical protein
MCGDPATDPGVLPGELTMAELLSAVKSTLGRQFYYFSQDNVADALKKGLDAALGQKLISSFLVEHVSDCYGSHDASLYDRQVDVVDVSPTLSGPEIDGLKPFFPIRTLFQLQFSGAKGWVAPLEPPTITLDATVSGGSEYGLVFTVVLDPTLPAVTPYDKKVLGGVDYATEDPLVMILLDDAIKLVYTSSVTDPDCCLEPTEASDVLEVSGYHFFKHLRIKEATTQGDALHTWSTSIVTDICGMKNVIVQNDQSLMDVNAPMYPFGTRPSIVDFSKVQPTFDPAQANLVGPNFYIGSAEIFCKAWTNIWIGINWKDLPMNFQQYYIAYYYDESTGDFGLHKDQFWVNLSVLRHGRWHRNIHAGFATHDLALANGHTHHDRLLFDIEADGSSCQGNNGYANSFYLTPDDFHIQHPHFVPFPQMKKYNADSREGFLRITLENQDFLHKDYPFVLARQMLAFGKLPDDTIAGAVYYNEATKTYFVVDGPLAQAQFSAMVNSAQTLKNEAVAIKTDAGAFGSGDIDHTVADPDVRDKLQDHNDPSIGLIPDIDGLKSQISSTSAGLTAGAGIKKSAVIPKEPWTPIIANW